MKKSTIMLIATLSLAASRCTNDTEQVDSVPVASFKLTNGSSVSDAAADDYNPVMLQLSNGTLALAFASTRSCAPSVCSGHNLFVASSVSAYNNDAKVPAFNTPQVITANGTPVNYATRLRLTGLANGTNINIFIKDVSGIISNTGLISPVSSTPINVGAGMPAIGNYNCYSQTMLGIDAAGQMISTPGSSGPISRYDPNAIIPCPTGAFASTAMASAVNISILRASGIGLSEGFFAVDGTGKLTAHTATSKGPVIQHFVDTLTKASLYLTSAIVFNANQAAGDLLVFSASAGSGLPSDMYILANKTPTALWLKYTAFGAQPVP